MSISFNLSPSLGNFVAQVTGMAATYHLNTSPSVIFGEQLCTVDISGYRSMKRLYNLPTDTTKYLLIRLIIFHFL